MRKIILPLLLALFSFGLVNAQNYHINEDFNASTLPANWTNNAVNGTNVWSFGIDGTGSHASNQNLDQTPFVFFDDDAYGAASSSDFVELVTPVFDNSSVPWTTLEFDYNFRGYTFINDSFFVEVFDGVNWNLVFSVTLDDCGNYISSACSNGFPHAVVDIGAYKNANCQVRFRYFDGHDPSDWGWYVGFDNVQIYSPFPTDVQVSEIIQPVSGCGLSSAATMEVELKNLGSLAASNFDVEVVLDGAVIATENVTTTIPAGDSLTYTFVNTANLSNIKSYDFKFYTKLSGDGNQQNDTAFASVSNEPFFTPTYVNDFETSPDEWSTGGVLSSWQKGVPTRAPLNTAASGTQVWMTNLTGAHNNNELSYLVSPCLDFSSSIGDPIINFSLIYDLENGADFTWMEYSTDNGSTWTKLMAAQNASRWYNNTTQNAWNGSSSGWLNVENILTGLAGESQVKLRMVFDSDAGSVQQGVGFDKFSIRNPQPIDLAINELINPIGLATYCGFSSAENIIIEVENKGANAISNYDVSYQIDNGGSITETVGSTLQPNTRYTYIFKTKANLSGTQTYQIDTWVSATGDGFLQNDSILNKSASNSTTRNAVPLPYLEDFNSFTAGTNFSNANDALTNSWTRSGAGGNPPGWRVSSGDATTHSGNTAPDEDCTEGLGGNFMYLEVSDVGNGQIAYLESPCIDMSRASGAKLEYCYHKFGSDMGDLYVDIETGKGWVAVDSVIGQTHTSKADDWNSREVNLNQFAGQRFRVRFRGESVGCCAGDMAIDDFFIYEPFEKEAEMLGVVAPEDGCSIDGSAEVTVEIFNNGTLDILSDSLFLYYQIDRLQPVKDTFDGTLGSEQSTTFTFSQTADLSTKGKKYNIKTWVEYPGDPVQLNDTVLNYRVTNHTRFPGYVENMESFKDPACDNTIGQVLENGWSVEPGTYMWHVQKARCGQGDLVTPTSGTGPNGDHTSPTGKGLFLYSARETSYANGTAIATLVSNCIDLTNSTNAKFSFWYHKFGSTMGNLTVQASDGGSWTNLTTINGATQNSASDAWKLAVVDISAYSGSLMQVRLLGTNGGVRGNMAIDDIYVYEGANIDVGLSEMPSPEGSSCNLPDSSDLTLRVNNFGALPIQPNSVELRFTNNKLNLIIDTLPQGIPVGSSVLYTLPKKVFIGFHGNQVLRAEAVLLGDAVDGNNKLEKIVENRLAGLPSYVQDFETFKLGAANYSGDVLNGWERIPDGTGHSWHVWQGNAPTMGGEPMPAPPIPANGPSGDHTFATDIRNGDGQYMLVETKFRNVATLPDAELYFPCDSVDLSRTKNGNVLLSFWYHMFGGNTGDLFIDFYDGTNWINGAGGVIRGVDQVKATDPWKEHFTTIDSRFAGKSNAHIRLRAEYIPGGNGAGGGDIGIDDIRLVDRENRDMWVKYLTEPESGCDMSTREKISVRVQNLGVNDIFQTVMAYQITHTGLDEVVTRFPIQRDTFASAQIIPIAQNTYEFTDRADFSVPGKYEVKVWAEYFGDQNVFNDTIVEVIENITRGFPSCEDWSTLTFGDKGPDYTDELLPNNWISSQGASYAWTATIQAEEEVGGPFPGHTSGNNDLYMLLSGGMPGQTAWIQSPCFDLRNTQAANLQFFYQAGAGNHLMFIQARANGSGWIDLDTLEGRTQGAVTRWSKVELVLADFVGSIVDFRFFAVNTGGGYYAIDDICVISPPPQQIELEEVVLPRQGLCWYGDEELVKVKVQNVGKDRIDSFRLVLSIDNGTPKIPRGQFQRDTLMIYPNNPTLDPGMKLEITLDSTVDFSAYDQYYISAEINLPGDIDTTDQQIINWPYTHADPIDLPYIIDFENTTDPLQRLIPNPSLDAMGVYRWAVWNVSNGLPPDNDGLTGPGMDHTFQSITGPGHYIMSQGESNPFQQFGDEIFLISECIDLQNATAPEMSFWYHMFSASNEMGNLYIEINDDFGWDAVDSLKGADLDQSTNFDPWKKVVIDLRAYAGDVVRFRFRSVRGPTEYTDMAIDDISVYDKLPQDIAVAGLKYPNDERTSCYTDTQTVRVDVRNNGADSIDFTVDVMNFEVRIRKDDVPWDTLYKVVNQNIWLEGPNATTFSKIPPDSVATVVLDGSFDMSDIGSEFEFTMLADFGPDLIASNDSIVDTVLAQRRAGYISSVIEPNDTVCYETPVQLTLVDWFGAIKWQEKTLDRNGNGFWFDGFSFPNDSAQYPALLDTTTELRVEICRIEQTVPVTVEVTKPYPGVAINGQICGSNQITIGMETPDNITKVRLYHPSNDTVALDSVLTPNQTLPNGNLEWLYTTVNQLEAGTRYDTIGYVLDQNLDTVFTVDTVAVDSIHVFYAETIIDSCVTNTRVPVYAVITQVPTRTSFPNFPANGTVCQDTSLVLNAGGEDGRKWKYDWTIYMPDGRVVTDSVDDMQTVIVDAWQLEKNKTYIYEVFVTTDSGCAAVSPIRAEVTIVDSCVTSIKEYKFGDEFKLYPNPTSDDIFIEYRSLKDLNGQVSLISMEGKLIEEKLDVDFREGRTRFNLGRLPKGIYFIRIKTKKGTLVRKVVKS